MLKAPINGLRVGSLDLRGRIPILGMQHIFLPTRVEGYITGTVVLVVVKNHILWKRCQNQSLKIRYLPRAIRMGFEIGAWAHRKV
jgi:hypothetical protein